MTGSGEGSIEWTPTNRWAAQAVRWLAIFLGLYHLYTAAFGPPVALVHRTIHLGGMSLLGYALLAYRPGRTRTYRWFLVSLAVLAATANLYLVVNYRQLAGRVGFPTDLDLVLAGLCLVYVIHLAQRMYGWPLAVTALVALVYAFAGASVPSFMAHRGYELSETLEFLYTTTEGIYGIPIQVSSSYIVIFIIFAAFLERSGIVRLFNDLAFAVAGWARGGVAKMAVISSALMGMISGSGLANVTTVGSVTIPMMKRAGFEPHYAAGVEATASMGGQIMPPVMGVAAFLMAERLGVPYSRIALGAVIPAVLYFLAIGMQIHFHAGRVGLTGASDRPGRGVGEILRTEGYLLGPVFLLIVMMLLGYSPLYAAVSSIVASLIVSWSASLSIAILRGRGWRDRWRVFAGECSVRSASPTGILASLEAGARNTVGVASACAVVGVIIGVVTLTGAGLKLSSAIVATAGGQLVPTLILTMLACFVLGMGLPTIPTYIITSTMAAPALVKLGVHRIAADFYVMYFGILANLTPPVALTAYAAAGIAGSDPLATCFTAIRLSVAGFIVPYIFVYSPIMLGVGFTPGGILVVAATGVAGVVALAASMEGYLFRETTWFERALLLAAAIDLIIPGMVTDLIGAALFLLVAVTQRLRAPG